MWRSADPGETISLTSIVQHHICKLIISWSELSENLWLFGLTHNAVKPSDKDHCSAKPDKHLR